MSFVLPSIFVFILISSYVIIMIYFNYSFILSWNGSSGYMKLERVVPISLILLLILNLVYRICLLMLKIVIWSLVGIFRVILLVSTVKSLYFILIVIVFIR